MRDDRDSALAPAARSTITRHSASRARPFSWAGQSRSAADQTVEMIKAAGGKATPNYDSVATPEGGQNIIQTAVDTYGKIDILVHVAGILRDRMVFNMSIEEWDAVINVHLRGAFCVNKPACVLMRAQKSGCIINFSSISADGNSGQAK